ncbi:hypothetical protein [Burkholderia cepacia]|uniref:hypothetical protein n=1 Tax=Burkholderia cepacia TaxID=292 RepID=UPI0002D65008|nr:hypothetical protein [Burkholderia cepacia]
MGDILAPPAVNSRGYSSSRKIIVEEYVGGDEFSAEMVWDPQAALGKFCPSEGAHSVVSARR